MKVAVGKVANRIDGFATEHTTAVEPVDRAGHGIARCPGLARTVLDVAEVDVDDAAGARIEDQDAVLAFSEGKTDNLLTGMNTNDYAAFSRDFDQDMLDAMSQTQFAELKKDRDAKLGLYLSREVHSVTQTGDFYTVNYDAKFEKDDAVTIRVVFRIAEPHQVSGLWFNK